ncbi:MAG: hypothetical protein ACK2T4_05025 [Candidatus Promineifilaceae bacterium]
MSESQIRILGVGSFFVIVFLSGLALSRRGMPYNSAVLTVHKLIALAVLVFLVVNAYRGYRAGLLGTLELVVVAIAVLLFVATIATGGALSTGKAMPEIVSRMHQITPLLTVAGTAVALFFLLKLS